MSVANELATTRAATPQAIPKNASVKSQVDRMKGLIGELTEAVSAIRSRCQPVIVESPNQPELSDRSTGSPCPPMCPLAYELETLNDEIEQVVRSIAHMTAVIDL